MANRVSTLERDVGEVRNTVNHMDEKIDMLLNSAFFSARGATSTPPRSRLEPRDRARRLPQSPDSLGASMLPTPRELLRRQNEGGYVDEMLRKERFAFNQPDSKAHIATKYIL